MYSTYYIMYYQIIIYPYLSRFYPMFQSLPKIHSTEPGDGEFQVDVLLFAPTEPGVTFNRLILPIQEAAHRPVGVSLQIKDWGPSRIPPL